MDAGLRVDVPLGRVRLLHAWSRSPGVDAVVTALRLQLPDVQLAPRATIGPIRLRGRACALMATSEADLAGRCRHLRSHYDVAPGLGVSRFAKLCVGASMREGRWRTVFPDRGGERACSGGPVSAPCSRGCSAISARARAGHWFCGARPGSGRRRCWRTCASGPTGFWWCAGPASNARRSWLSRGCITCARRWSRRSLICSPTLSARRSGGRLGRARTVHRIRFSWVLVY